MKNMSASSSYQHRPLYATQRSSKPRPPLRRAAAFFISRAGLASASLSQNPHWGDLKTQLNLGPTSSSRHFNAWPSPFSSPAPSSPSQRLKSVVTKVKPTMQFIRGVDELAVPDVSLTRSLDGRNGVATFVFDQPSVFDSSKELGDITGLYMIDNEGVLQTVDVSAKFVNGQPAKIEAKFVMKTPTEWDRFMRFMERYGVENNLGFVKK